jgi:hypothetical protein
MKTVIVFDTEDDRGMQDALKIMSYLFDQYLMKQMPSRHKLQFGKIEFIKELRTFATTCLEVGTLYPNSLKDAKLFADKVWAKKNGDVIKDIF